MNSTAIAVFENALLSNATGYVAEWNSGAVPVNGNRVAFNAIVKNMTGTSARLKVSIEGTYDGQSWVFIDANATTVNLGTLSDAPITAVGFRFVRLRALYTASSTGTVIFSAQLAFSTV